MQHISKYVEKSQKREADIDVIVMPKYVWQNSGTVVVVAAALPISSTVKQQIKYKCKKTYQFKTQCKDDVMISEI